MFVCFREQGYENSKTVYVNFIEEQLWILKFCLFWPFLSSYKKILSLWKLRKIGKVKKRKKSFVILPPREYFARVYL